MPESYKILSQLVPTDTLENVLYTSPVNTQTLVTNITVTNRSASAQTFDISVYNNIPILNNFVAIKSPFPAHNTVMSSTNAVNWTTGTFPSTARWNNLFFANSKFLSVSNFETVAATSTNGITWTQTTTPLASTSWNSIAYGNNTYVLGASSSSSLRSTDDGTTWTAVTLPSFNQWRGATFGNGKFILIAYNSGTALYSTNGLTWTITTMPNATHGWQTAAYGADKFFATGGGGFAATLAASSTDGITWTTRTMPAVSEWSYVFYLSNTWLAFGAGNSANTTAASSTDGITWTLRTMPSSAFWSGATYANGNFYASPGNLSSIAYSTDLITWTTSTLPSNAYQIQYGSFPSPKLNNLYKNVTIAANSSEILEPGIALGAQNSISIKGNSNLTFSAYGMEIS